MRSSVDVIGNLLWEFYMGKRSKTTMNDGWILFGYAEDLQCWWGDDGQGGLFATIRWLKLTNIKPENPRLETEKRPSIFIFRGCHVFLCRPGIHFGSNDLRRKFFRQAKASRIAAEDAWAQHESCDWSGMFWKIAAAMFFAAKWQSVFGITVRI